MYRFRYIYKTTINEQRSHEFVTKQREYMEDLREEMEKKYDVILL